MRDGRKVPYRCGIDIEASSTDPQTWGTFDEATKKLANFDGIGYVFSPSDGITGIDLDGCIDVAGSIVPEAQSIIDKLASYTELSPSGRGVHVFVKAELPPVCRHKLMPETFKEIECYDRGRYFTVTGRHVEGTPLSIEDRQAELDEILEQYTPKPKPRPAPPAPTRPTNGQAHAGDNLKRCLAYLDAMPEAISGQGGHDRTFNAACECYRFRLDDAQARQALDHYNATKCQPPWTDADLVHKLESARERVTADGEIGCRLTERPSFIGNGQSGKHPLPQRYATTDVGNAERFARDHAGTILRDNVNKRWLLWDGKRWRADERGRAVELAKRTARGIINEAIAEPEDHRRQELLKWAAKTENHQRLTSMLALAESDPRLTVTPDELDADPWLLNCKNGVLDLRTGDLRKHDPALRITRLAPTKYIEDARHATWDKVLNDATGGDTELQAFLSRAAGYTMTGSTAEEVLFMVIGPGGTAKTTFVEGIKATLGDYATTADFESFVEQRGGSHIRSDVVRLDGARFVASVEVSDGRRLAQGLIKMLTGGDKVTARPLYKSEVEFTPQFKLWLAANHAPRCDDTDSALWRRIIRIPFEHVIPPEQRDPRIKETVKTDPAARSAILAWMFTGCLAWQACRLRIPETIRHATEAYRRDLDPMRDFIDECCDLNPYGWTATKELRAAYVAYCEETGIRHVLSPRGFAERLQARGCDPSKRGSARGYAGITLQK